MVLWVSHGPKIGSLRRNCNSQHQQGTVKLVCNELWAWHSMLGTNGLIGLDKRKIVNIFLPISFNICFGCSKVPSHWEEGSLVYPQHTFWMRNKFLFFGMLTTGLNGLFESSFLLYTQIAVDTYQHWKFYCEAYNGLTIHVVQHY